jgi:hypothetical protein
MNIVRIVAVAALLSIATPSLAACDGKMSGALQATFKCSASAAVVTANSVSFVLSSSGALPAGLKMVAPASIEMPEPLKTGTYDLAAMGQGGTVVVLSDGARFGASKARQGSTLSITLSKVVPNSPIPGHYAVSGTLRAHAVQARGTGAVDIEVAF